jgi:hypothetical protein
LREADECEIRKMGAREQEKVRVKPKEETWRCVKMKATQKDKGIKREKRDKIETVW